MTNSTFVLGGARSGKSHFALELASKNSVAPIFIATAQALDDEMTMRIANHRQKRGPHWTTVECSVDLVEVLAEFASDATVVVDCLTLWLSNLMHIDRSPEDETKRLCDAIRQNSQELILVSNEVGLGLVPETALGRDFRDAQGRLNQAVADAADEVFFIAAGISLQLK